MRIIASHQALIGDLKLIISRFDISNDTDFVTAIDRPPEAVPKVRG
ncbi:hypothetical protein NB541_11470 [Vibrio parahaemolyticus]|nr:hypothetical protein [Vibrio parahaemolyticus]MCR9955993.1 hypothetical protein [Vibrio parahaemolyticus]